MDYKDYINCSLEETPREQIITDIVELSILFYKKHLESKKTKQYAMLICDCNGNELIQLCYRADFTYFSYFEPLREQLIAACREKGYPVVLKKFFLGNHLLPQSKVKSSEFARVLSEEQQKLSLTVAQIECLELHPSLQRQGTFTQIIKGLLSMEETQSVIVTNIYNKEWLEHLKKKVTETADILHSRAVLFDGDLD
ncbi:hypothetical protein HJ171_20680 [Vibrio parahaemolyticus]|uniref:hypothetical protein n=1 Tax=Vibrio parahaemolyticus TaxID=670 RepID=UPI0011244571|nr:hypothetical protein [Vibrio parahaemolyticus]MBE3839614.1 hypothetical protein [Vibrio parahaemolyticus]TOA76569.1 hypothetical protein CGK19_22435 [Vibrio parahaemolyticus]TOF29575.1 hypothetical protein CGJ25_18135 [Vibrio parahaemolyticus]